MHFLECTVTFISSPFTKTAQYLIFVMISGIASIIFHLLFHESLPKNDNDLK